MSLVLTASLVGKASTPSEHGHVQVTLKIGNQNLYLQLLPEQAAMFPDLVRTIPHKTERKAQQLQYLPSPSYTVTIEQVVPEPTTREVALRGLPARAGTHPLTEALVNAQAAVAEKANAS